MDALDEDAPVKYVPSRLSLVRIHVAVRGIATDTEVLVKSLTTLVSFMTMGHVFVSISV